MASNPKYKIHFSTKVPRSLGEVAGTLAKQLHLPSGYRKINSTLDANPVCYVGTDELFGIHGTYYFAVTPQIGKYDIKTGTAQEFVVNAKLIQAQVLDIAILALIKKGQILPQSPQSKPPRNKKGP